MVKQTYGVHWNNDTVLMAFLGGLILGVIAVCRMMMFGKVTGISGIVSGLVKLELPLLSANKAERFLYAAGLVVSGETVNVQFFVTFIYCRLEALFVRL